MLIVAADKLRRDTSDLKQGLPQAPASLCFAAIRPKQLDEPITANMFVSVCAEIRQDRPRFPAERT
jgi:hypothetical protein